MELHESAFGGRPARNWWKRNYQSVWFLVFFILMSLVAAKTGLAIRDEVQRDNVNSHSAWVKLTGRTDITYEEWMALRRAGIEVNTTTK